MDKILNNSKIISLSKKEHKFWNFKINLVNFGYRDKKQKQKPNSL